MFWGGQAFLTYKIKYGGFFKVVIERTQLLFGVII